MAVSPKVFISYVREDQQQAVQMSRDLKALGVQPWLDLTQMVPGINWRVQIEDALDACDYVVLLLSHNSIDKRGYGQVEKRYILDKLNHLPPNEIFLIPARLEECNPRHKQIQDIQRVDLFPSWDEGVRKIALSLGLSKKVIKESEVSRSKITEEPQKISNKDYFDVVLPTMLRWKGEEATKLNKKVRITLSESESWTINFEPPVATVVAGDQSDVNLTIKLIPDYMQAILAGEFNAKKAIADGDIELYGDLSLLKSVGMLFSSVKHDRSK